MGNSLPKGLSKLKILGNIVEYCTRLKDYRV